MEEEYVLITTTPLVTSIHTFHISIPVHLYIDLRIQNTHNLDIKLLQYLSLIQQNNIAESWVGMSTVTG
jgi:hypothetical protein